MITIKHFVSETFRSLKKEGSFAQSYAFVLSGTGLNILIQVLISPILTRIYEPEAYGIFSIFNAVCTNIALIATLRFPQALLLPQDEKDFHTLMRLSILSALFTSFMIFGVLTFASTAFLSIFQAEKLSGFYFLIPVMIFLISLNQVLGQWQYRLMKFKQSVAIDTGVLIGVRIFNLVFGWLTQGATLGLVIGDMLGKTMGLVLSWRLVIRQNIKFLFSHISLGQLKKVFREYRQYPLLNLPGVWFTLFSDQLSIFFISSAFGLNTLGAMALASSMLDLPKRLFAYTVTSVFYRKAVELKKESLEALGSMVVRIMYLLLAVSIIPYTFITAFGPEVFAFVFGSEWEMSGRIAQYFSVYCIVELLYISLDSVFYVMREEKRMFLFQVSTFFVRFVVLFLAIRASLPLESCILLLAAANTLIYSVQLSYILHMLRLRWWKHLFFIFVLGAVFIGLFFGLRIAL